MVTRPVVNASGIDILFSFDTTGSMYPCLAEVRRKLAALIKRLFAQIPDLRIGSIAHGDYCDERSSYVLKKTARCIREKFSFGGLPGRGSILCGIALRCRSALRRACITGSAAHCGPFPGCSRRFSTDHSSYVLKMLDLTDDLRSILAFVETVGRTGGGDSEECYELVLHEARNATWQAERSRVVVLIADDEPHEAHYFYRETAKLTGGLKKVKGVCGALLYEKGCIRMRRKKRLVRRCRTSPARLERRTAARHHARISFFLVPFAAAMPLFRARLGVTPLFIQPRHQAEPWHRLWAGPRIQIAEAAAKQGRKCAAKRCHPERREL
jgi:hypothetical protein